MKERIINIGPRLKQRRKEMRIKQTEMAKELGVSQTYLSNRRWKNQLQHNFVCRYM